MKNPFHMFLAVILAPLLVNCSSIPEIQPYQQPEEEEFSLDTLTGRAADDSVFEDVSLNTTPAVENETVAETSVAAVEEQPTTTSSSDVEFTKPVKSKIARVLASASGFKNGYYTFSSDCSMKKEPNSESADAGNVPAGKKLWLDGHNDQWLKAYKKAGTVYVPANCIQ